MRKALFVVFAFATSLMIRAQSECLSGDCQDGKGEMIIEYTNGDICIYNGSFQFGRRNGQGNFQCENFFEKGLFENGVLIEGEYISARLFQRGSFVNRELHGHNCYEKGQQENGNSFLNEGRFVNGALFKGKSISKSIEGFVEECVFEDGELLGCTTNTENRHISSEIQGPDSTTFNVVYVGNQTYVPLSIGSVNFNILWDTGAFGLILSKSDFKKLIENGAELYDLNLSIQTFGVLNIPSEAHYYILNNLRIGEMVVNNIVCLYNPSFENSLLGLDFFHKFSDVEWHMKDGTLSLYN
jgi:hypothetical protein